MISTVITQLPVCCEKVSLGETEFVKPYPQVDVRGRSHRRSPRCPSRHVSVVLHQPCISPRQNLRRGCCKEAEMAPFTPLAVPACQNSRCFKGLFFFFFVVGLMGQGHFSPAALYLSV